MNFEILVEDMSGGKLLESLVPKILGYDSCSHSWRIHTYRGLGRLPKNLKAESDPSKRKLLHRLPDILAGYDRSPGYDFVMVLMDSDARDCKAMLHELKEIPAQKELKIPVMFRLSIEEVEAWYFGDRAAIAAAYPKARLQKLASYQQDSVCGTWEALLEITHQRIAKSVKGSGWMAAGKIKHEWATLIGPFMDIDRNESPSFQKFKNGLRRMLDLQS